MKFKPSLLIGAVVVSALAGCSSSKDSAATPVPSVSSPAGTAVQPKGDFAALQGVVTQTKAAVDGGDYTKAKSEFDKFEGFWSKVEDGVKAKSRDNYDAIETGASAVKSALKESKSNKAIAALNALNKMIMRVAKP